ncbi:hypothetical protein I33_3206 [Bacillus subtilis subsp. subtilis str. RO-NN-1]|nr:hypothetical protein I33_3206 [Bacillus subtilis subsp. subtilis str. RO-NN-1]
MSFERFCHLRPNVIMPLFVFFVLVLMDKHDTGFSFQTFSPLHH